MRRFVRFLDDENGAEYLDPEEIQIAVLMAQHGKRLIDGEMGGLAGHGRTQFFGALQQLFAGMGQHRHASGRQRQAVGQQAVDATSEKG